MMMTCLINEMLKCRCVINRSIVVEIGVKGEVGERLPWRLIGRDFEAVEIERRIMTDGRAGDHRNTLDAAVSHLAALLSDKISDKTAE